MFFKNYRGISQRFNAPPKLYIENPNLSCYALAIKRRHAKRRFYMKLTKAQIALINKIINAKLSSKEISEIKNYIDRVKGDTPDYDNDEE